MVISDRCRSDLTRYVKAEMGKGLTRVLVSDLSRDGIEHCLHDHLHIATSGWVFENLESTVRSLAGQTRPGPGFLPIE